MMIAYIPKHIRALVSAFMLALTIASIPAGFVHAATYTSKNSCEEAGFVWSSTKGCADKTCFLAGKYVKHGDTYTSTSGNGKSFTWRCNGWTGHNELVRTAQPEVPQAPRPTTNAPRTTGP